MSTFRMQIWREWREHRVALLTLTAILPLLVFVVAFAVPARRLGNPTFYCSSALLALFSVLVVVGGEVLATGSANRWLERLPGGLRSAFPAKLALFGATSAVALLYGYGIGVGCALSRGSGGFAWPKDELCLEMLLFPGSVLALWTFAASAWSSRGLIALFGGALVAGVFALPFWVHTFVGYRPAAWEMRSVLALLVGAPLPCAWVGFVLGGRYGRGGISSALRGIPLAGLCLLPTWGLGLWRWHEREELDPRAPEFAIHAAWISEDGRIALLASHMQNDSWEDVPSHVLRVDLGTGAWEGVGGRNAHFEELGAEVELGPLAAETCVWVESNEDPAAARMFAAADARPMDGKQVAELQGGWWVHHAGLGWLVLRGPFRPLPALYDPFHRVSVPLHELGLLSDDEIYVGPERWLVRRGLSWFECAPGAHELVAAEWMTSVLVPGPMLADGRMFVEYMSEEAFEYGLVDPGRRQLVPLHRGWERDTFELRGAYSQHRYSFRAGEAPLLDTADGRFLFDETSMSLLPVFGVTWEPCVRSFADGTVILIDKRGRLVRQNLETDGRAVLFPRQD